jgi:hypothetical protein
LLSCSSLTSLLVVSAANLLLLFCILLKLSLYPDSLSFKQDAIDAMSTFLVFLMCLVYPVTSPIIGIFSLLHFVSVF